MLAGVAQALDGEDGARAADGAWPAFHRSTAHTSPLAHDVDYDGVLDLLIATYDGEILAIRDTVRPPLAGATAMHTTRVHCR